MIGDGDGTGDGYGNGDGDGDGYGNALGPVAALGHGAVLVTGAASTSWLR